MDFDDIIKVIAVLIGVGWTLYDKFLKGPKAEEPTVKAKPPPPRRAPARPSPAPAAARAAPAPAGRFAAPPKAPSVSLSVAQQRLVSAVAEVEHDSKALGESVRHALANRRFVEVLTEWLPGRCKALRAQVAHAGPAVSREQMGELNSLLMVLSEIREQVRQREDRALLPLLGDADALAEACYRPILDFTQGIELPISTALPVTRLSEVDLAIWTGFAPTAIAPIFLPPDFFNRLAWWPALGHEIGHDFLISVDGLRDRIADELQLPGEQVGSRPLNVYGGQLAQGELWRVHGGWLEELFADVFGTLMCGPAYGFTMVELFSFEEDAREVLVVPPDPQTGGYTAHPPRHLRVHACAMVLDRAGFSVEARALLARWHERNQLDRDAGVPLIFYTQQGYVYVPFEAVEPYTREIVERLYVGPLSALRGFGLKSISGLDYGPHQHAQAQRAKASLLAGQVPAVRDVRAVISGAVLAWLEHPANEAKILHLARAAIPAVGTFERRPDAYHKGAARHSHQQEGPVDFSPESISEALVLRELLQRPSVRRSRRPGQLRAVGR